MDSSQFKEIWKRICDQVKQYENIDPNQINAFFSRLQIQAMSEGFLMLTADTDFIKIWIERHYIESIQRALGDIYGIPYMVMLEVDPSQTRPVAETAPSNNPAPIVNTQVIEQTATFAEAAGVDTDETVMTESAETSPYNDYDGSEDNELPTEAMTFENYVIGDSNRMAYSMAVAVAENPGKPHLNPLFIYGKSGLGKTHLMRAIQNYIAVNMPWMNTIYVDSAEFLNQYTEAMVDRDRDKSLFKNFKAAYDNVDVLLIDDVQYFQGKKQTLDIVFQIFNKLTDNGKQVVLSADRAPKNIDIDERYKTRFNSGGTFDIQPPEMETKLGIVRSFIEDYKQSENVPDLEVPKEIQVFIAENSSSNIRELKSAVARVIFRMHYMGMRDLKLNDVRELLESHFSTSSSKRLDAEQIQAAVQDFFKISHADLVGKKRTRNIMYARQMGIYLCRQILDLPYNDIGKKFNRDHSTVMHSVQQIEEKMRDSREMREEIEALRQIILEA